MGFVLPDFIRCPYCGKSLSNKGASLVCTGEKPHNYDIAKEGYVNLLPPGRAKNSHTGDDADMIKAREVFLSGGGYDRYSREAAELAAEVILCQNDTVMGCHRLSDGEMPIFANGGFPTTRSPEKVARCSEGIIGDTVMGHLHSSDKAQPIFANGGFPTTRSPEKVARCSEGIIGDTVVGHLHSSDKAQPIFANGGFPVIVDAGCGEGRHTVNMAKTLADALDTPVIAAGFDASKFGVRAAAKRYVKNGCPAERVTPVFAAANIFSLPITDGCADVFTSLFAPLPEDEARRVLSPGGVLVICAAGADHLTEMRSVLYENPIPSGGGAAVPDGFTVAREKIIKYKIELSSQEEIMSLFTMTPFYYNAPSEGRAKLEELSSMTVTVQVKCTVAVKDQ